MPWELQPPIMSTIMPSPALTYPEKPRRVSANPMPDPVDDSWSIFSAPDRSAVGNVMAGGSPSTFSPWASDTPFFRLGNEMALEPSNFMDLEGQGVVEGGVPLGGLGLDQRTSHVRQHKAKDSIWTEIIS